MLEYLHDRYTEGAVAQNLSGQQAYIVHVFEKGQIRFGHYMPH